MTPSVSLDGVVKAHGPTMAVDHVSLTILNGEFFSILGPSGAGKTTLLRLIAGLEFPDKGEISIQGRVVTSDTPYERPVNMVFQHYALFPHMSVFENVAFGLRRRRECGQNIQKAVGEMLELVRLQGKEQRLPSQLSGGEQQRVALARALVNRPVVVLLDEPLAALDQQLRQEMQMELKRLQREVNATFICVTHHQDDALILSDRVGVMHGGRLLQAGTPQEVYNQPASSFVARFVGHSNIFSGRITRQEDDWCWVEQEGFPPVVARGSSQISSHEMVNVMIRPERLHISVEGSTPQYDNTIPATLIRSVFSGSEVWYHLRLSNEALWMARVPITEDQARPLTAGQRVLIQWSAPEGLALAH